MTLNDFQKNTYPGQVLMVLEADYMRKISSEYKL